MLLFCIVSMLSVFVHAAELQVTYHIGDTPFTSEVSTEGHLVELLKGEENAMKWNGMDDFAVLVTISTS